MILRSIRRFMVDAWETFKWMADNHPDAPRQHDDLEDLRAAADRRGFVLVAKNETEAP